MSRRAKTKVFLNVYDLSAYNKHLHGFGLGAYHTGIEINGTGMLRFCVSGLSWSTCCRSLPVEWCLASDISCLRAVSSL